MYNYLEYHPHFTDRSLEDVYQSLLEHEIHSVSRRFNETSGSIELAQTKLADESSWVDYALKYQKPRILDLGSGCLASAWTGMSLDIDANVRSHGLLNPGVQILQQNHNPYQVTCTSAVGKYANLILDSGVDEFIPGHFIQILNNLLDQERQFDIVLSRFALYQSRFIFEILDKIDMLLSSSGAAFLDTVQKRGSSHFALFRSRDLPDYYLDKTNIRKSLSFKDAGIAGLPWQNEDSIDNVAWTKGMFDRGILPIFYGVNQLDTKFIDHPLFWAIYHI